MEVFEILEKAKKQGVSLKLKEGNLAVKAEKGKIDADFLEILKENKTSIVNHLNIYQKRSRSSANSSEKIQVYNRTLYKHIPLSFNQERLWFLDGLQGTVEYHIPFALRLSGDLNKEALFLSLKEIVTRHEILRTVIYAEEGVGYQKVLSPDAWKLPFEDRTADASDLSEDLKIFLSTPFDLGSDYMFRSCLYDLGEQEYVLAGVIHHIASDGWSRGILIREFVQLYRSYVSGKESLLVPLSMQYADYALWQREHLNEAFIDKHLSYWEHHLKDVSTLQLPKDYERPAVRSISGANISFVLDSNLSTAVHSLSKQEGVTAFMTLMAAFKVLLGKYSGQEDICVGSSVANRTQKELENMMGFFVNTLPFRTKVEENSSFRELLQLVKKTTLDAYDHQQAPLEEIVNRVVKTRDTRINPIFQVMFLLQGAQDAENAEIKKIERLSLSNYKDRQLTTSQFDLNVTITETTHGFNVDMNYATSLFKEETIQRMFAHYQQLLKSIIASPVVQMRNLSMLIREERHQLLEVFNDTAINYPTHKTVIDLFEEQVTKTPDVEALVSEGERLTYRELNEKSNQLAHYFRAECKIASEDIIGILLDRSIWSIISMLGILKSGACYLPIDKTYPDVRKRFIVEDAAIKLLIVDSESLSEVSDYDVALYPIDTKFDQLASERYQDEYKPSPESLAYIIYTSGSTGNPKGVMVEHKNLLNYLSYSMERYRIHTDSYNFPLFSSLSFDLTQTSIYLTLLTGGALHIYKDNDVSKVFVDIAANKSINTIKLTPSHLSFFKELDTSRIQNYIIGGEQLMHADLKNLGSLHPSVRLFNEYGPTEATVGCVVSEVTNYEAIQTITIGQPIANTQIYILDAQENLVTIGAVGELCIGGAQVTRGYLNREELTQEKFVANHFKEGERLYKTGDLARWLSDGTIEFLGRKDNQVKVNGYRIELDEIEKALSGLPNVRQSCVLTKVDQHGDKCLVAYVVMKGDLDKQAIQSRLEESLPEYMVPRLWIVLEEMPLTSNGKIDRKNLLMSENYEVAVVEYVAPRTVLETQLAAIWQELLGIEQVGVYDNFFELGGQSILAIRLIARIRKLGYTVNISDFYDDPSIASLSTKLISIDQGYKVPENGIVKGCDYITPSMVTLVDLNQNELETIMDHVPGGAKNIQDIYPLSPLQEGIYFHHLMSGEKAGDPYVLPLLLSFSSLEKRSELLDAFRFVINRHDVLRTCVVSDGISKTVQVVLREAELNVEALTIDDSKEILPQVQAAVAHKNLWIDVSKAPILNVKIANDVTNNTYYFVVYYHHLMTDRIGRVKMMEEMELYLSGRAGLLPTSSLYRDFIGHTLNKKKSEESQNYFRELFKNIEAPTYPFNLSSTKMDGGTKVVASKTRLSGELNDSIRKVSSDLQVSPAVLFHAAFGLVVGRCSGTDYALFGSVLMGRLQASKSSESSLGLFLNTLPVLLKLKGDIRSYIDQTNKRLQSLLNHEHTPLSSVHDLSGIPNDIPMFSTLFNYRHQEKKLSEDNTKTALDTGIKALSATERTNYPINLAVEDYSDGFGLTFDIADIGVNSTAIVSYMEEALQQLVSNIDEQSQITVEELSILTEEETHQLLEVFNNTDKIYPIDKTVVDLFGEQVIKRLEATAVVCEGDSLTYKELDEKSNQVAHYLIDKGVSLEDIVGICMNRSLEMIISVMGIMKVGAAYVPIDPDYPQSRIDYMLKDSRVKVVLSSDSCIDIFRNIEDLDITALDSEWKDKIEKRSVKKLKNVPSSDNLAYVIYTSGSTGNPKGVMLEHKNLANFLYCQTAFYGTTAEDQSLLFTSLSFDPSVEQICVPLINGATLHVVPKDKLLNIEEAVELLLDKKITHLHAIPSFLRELPYIEGNSLKRIISGGDLFDKEIYKKWGNKGIRIINEFGPTETTITSSEHEMKADTMPSDVGKPVANTQLYILNPEGKLLPMGAIGELCIAGSGVARGYFNNDELTRQKFVTNPFKEGGRMYKTGDLARWLPSGNIEFLGRKDHQVKIRGFRVELSEIENVLSQLAGVIQPCVLAKQDSEGNNRLIAYVVMEEGLNKEALQSQLQNRLPEHMIPRLWVQMDEMPLTSNGKLDRKALLEQDGLELASKAYVGPRTLMEEQLVEIWQELLSIEKVGVHDNFFELGGHSLLATRLVSTIRKELNVEMTIRDVFAYTTIASLAAYLSTQKKGALLPKVIRVEERPKKIPLSFSQERLWFLDRLQGSVEYHIPFVLKLSGDLDKTALSSSLKDIVARHEVLRTVICSEEGTGYQEVLSPYGWEPIFKDMTNDVSTLMKDLKGFLSSPFDLNSDYMLRSCLYDLGDKEFVLAGVFHHISSDGWSQNILIGDFIELYNAYTLGKETSLPLLSLQYIDYALWQREHLEGTIIDDQLSYWENQLEGVSPLQLPTDYVRPAVQNTSGATLSFELDNILSKDIKALSQQEGATVFMTFLAAFKVLLGRYSGQDDICVGTPVANRTQKELEEMIGFFVNTLTLRTQIKGDNSFKELLQEVKQMTLEAYDYQQVPFEKVVERVVKTRDMSVTPLFQVLFMLQNIPKDYNTEMVGLKLSNYEVSGLVTSKFDITIALTETETGFYLDMNYATALFKKETIQKMFAHYQELLKAIVSSPTAKIGDLSILSEEEVHQLLEVFNDIAVSYPKDKTVVDLFEAQVLETPDAAAVVYDAENLTYKELDEKSNQLANYLIEKGVSSEHLIGICLDRSLEMIISIFGILKSGAAYIPIDPYFPQLRMDYMLEDSGVAIVLSDSKNSGGLSSNKTIDMVLLDKDKDRDMISKASKNQIKRVATPSNLAYVIYTSGSTGKPKGVPITHASLSNFLLGMVDRLEMKDLEVFLSVTTYTFDIFYLELFGPLLLGAQVVMLDKLSIREGNKLQEAIKIYQPDFMQATPSTWQMLIDSGWENKEAVTVLTGGEAINESLKNSLTRMSNTVWNLYGPTEATIWVTTQKLKASERVTLGRPISNVQLYVLDKNNAVVPVGVIGELCIGGAQLSSGYLNRESLTNEKFITNPFREGTQIYRTGDLVRWLSDGNIEFIGRKDTQVKIRGYRIELGEVENVLFQLPEVNHCCVLVKRDNQGNNRLVAYVVMETDFDKEVLQEQLQESLPEYMVPRLWVQLDEMPLTSNGKLDRKALPELDSSDLSTKAYVAPRTEVEAQLVKIWQELLGVEKVGIHDNFFELGGHSLLAFKIVTRINKILETDISLGLLFEHPTISQLIPHVNTKSMFDNNVLIPLQEFGNKRAIFLAPDGSGTCHIYGRLVKSLGNNQPVYGFHIPGLNGRLKTPETLDDMVALFVNELQKVDPHGPYRIGGYSFGAIIAYQMALRLQQKGFEVEELLMFDGKPVAEIFGEDEDENKAFRNLLSTLIEFHGSSFKNENLNQNDLFIEGKSVDEQINQVCELLQPPNKREFKGRLKVRFSTYKFMLSYKPIIKEKLNTKIILFKAIYENEEVNGEKIIRENVYDYDWGQYTAKDVVIHPIPANHHNVLSVENNIKTITELLEE
ncbi:non-ribosomal peptide synthetase [Tenacibaculum piscium]|uniref:non-ribosomal peptide synthetase n=1 Tax=Tenacibaculum piscium TaxID=1458515 RepID=UPI001F46C66D|nr:non-ribosomal peptide synthetase [Tenacibaculum piscium]